MIKNSVYITQYNHKKIIPEDLDVGDDKGVENVFEYIKLKNIFNEKELKQFFRLWVVLENPELLLKFYQNNLDINKPESYNSYHLNKNCVELSKNHLEYSIESKNKKIRDEISSRFRFIFKEYTYTKLDETIRFDFEKNVIYVKDDQGRLMIKGPIPKGINTEVSKLRQQYPEIIGELFDVIPNSGLHYYENQSLDFIEMAINKKINESEVFRNSSEVISKKINNKTFANISILKNAKDEHELIWVERYKEPLSKLVQSYYWIKFNPTLSVEKTVLDSLGFKVCKRCLSSSS